MKVEGLMATEVAVVHPDTDVRSAVGEMHLRECGFLPVLDGTGGVVGVLTDRDVALALGSDDARPSERLVADVMTGGARTCRADETVAQVLLRMREFRVRRLPVVNAAGRLVGAISIDDLVGVAQNVRAGTDRVSLEQVMQTITALAAQSTGGPR